MSEVNETALSLVPPFEDGGNRYSEADVRPWAEAAVNQACVLEKINDPAGYVATLHDVLGPWGFGETPEAARAELESVLVGWALLKLDDGDRDIPVMGGISLH